MNRWKVRGARVRASWPWQRLRGILFVTSRWCQSDWFSRSGPSRLWDKPSSRERPLSGFRSSQSLFETQLMLLERAHLPPPSTGTWSCGTSQLGVLIWLKMNPSVWQRPSVFSETPDTHCSILCVSAIAELHPYTKGRPVCTQAFFHRVMGWGGSSPSRAELTMSPSHIPLASADTTGLSQLTARAKNQFNQPPGCTPNLERLPRGGRRNTNLTKTQRARNSDSSLLVIARKTNKPPRHCSQTIRQQQKKQMCLSLFPTCTHLAPGQTSLTKDIKSNLRSSWLRVAFLLQRPLECSKGQGRFKEREEERNKPRHCN